MINVNDSVLVIIDVQLTLANVMHEHERLNRNLQRLIQASRIINIPTLLTEQAPEKIGPTDIFIHNLLPDVEAIHKHSFSAWGCEEFVKKLTALNRRQIILAGIETHVCIYQTATDLKSHGFEVFVVADAVSSRNEYNSHMSLERMRHDGITITVAESAICELIKTADHPKFREIMAYIK